MLKATYLVAGYKTWPFQFGMPMRADRVPEQKKMVPHHCHVGYFTPFLSARRCCCRVGIPGTRQPPKLSRDLPEDRNTIERRRADTARDIYSFIHGDGGYDTRLV